jgi:DNA repair exonuclease SbcCD ATPase subunit
LACQRLAAAATLAGSWEEHLEGFPDTVPVAAARIILVTAAERYQEAERKARAAIAEHAEANGRWQAKYGDFSRRAADINVPVDVAALTKRISELERAATTAATLQASLADRCRSAVSEVSQSIRQHTIAVDNRVAAESVATTSHGQYSTAAAALAIHLETLGADDNQHDRKLEELKTERDAAKTEGIRLQNAYDAAGKSALVLTTQLELVETTERDLRTAVTNTETSFEVARQAPGVWAAAQTPIVPDTMEDALATAADWSSATDDSALINELQILRSSLPGGFSSEAINSEDVLSIMVNDGEGSRPVTDAAARAAERLAGYREQVDIRYHKIFENYLLRDLSEHLRRQIDLAENLRARMNLILAEARSSQGVQVHLGWDPSPALDDATREALGLVRKSFATRSAEEDASLRRALQERIETERDSRNAHYREVLAHALDYRNWYTFTVRVRDTGPDGQQRDRLLRRLSSGETRLVSYVTLFAAAAAFYEALTVPGATPLRLVLLDEAFERLDDPTITRLLELLAELDMDWVITWPSGSAFSPKIKAMQVYDILKPKGAPGIAFVHTSWDGAEVRIEG